MTHPKDSDTLLSMSKPKLIPYTIKKNEHDEWSVIDPRTGAIEEVFETRPEAVEFLKSLRPNEDGEWEPDYEFIVESRGGGPDAAMERMEKDYESFLERWAGRL